MPQKLYKIVSFLLLVSFFVVGCGTKASASENVDVDMHLEILEEAEEIASPTEILQPLTQPVSTPTTNPLIVASDMDDSNDDDNFKRSDTFSKPDMLHTGISSS